MGKREHERSLLQPLPMARASDRREYTEDGHGAVYPSSEVGVQFTREWVNCIEGEREGEWHLVVSPPRVLSCHTQVADYCV